jgi:hypothetical protein
MANIAKSTHPGFIRTPVRPDVVADARASLPQYKNDLLRLGLQSSGDQVSRLEDVFASDNPTYEQVVSAVTDLLNRMEDELSHRVFYHIKPDVAGLLESEIPFSQEIKDSFPSASHDILEAGKCYACERFDATVYHLMRAMEVALKCLATRLNVKYYPGWGSYLNKIDKVLKSKAKSGKLRKKRLLFLGNAASLLRAVKEAWRDETMHMAGKYGPDQTRDIFNSVKAFLNFLSTDLSEKQ